MVTKEGLPVGYELFKGSTYEGHTLIPMIKNFQKKYDINKVLIVADAGMMNKDNIKLLEEEKLEYIIGCRLKNLNKDLQSNILDQSNYVEIEEGYKLAKFNYDNQKIIVSYSSKRARKDAQDRITAVAKLQKKLSKLKNPKEYLSNQGYKKYLNLEGESKITLNEKKIKTDEAWDGLHGVITNNFNISNREILAQYKNLWQVEEAFRVTKHDLKVRPIYPSLNKN